MKKSIKKLLAMGMIAAMAVTAAGCSGSSEETAAATEASETEATSEESSEAESSEDAEAAGEEAAADGETYKIGVIQYIQHDALDRANEGFVEALTEAGFPAEIDQQNASGDTSSCTTIAQKFVSDGDDLIFAIATPAAQAVAAETTDIPIVLTAVTDPADSGLVADNAAPGGNVTGSSDLTPVKEQIGLLHNVFPDAKTVGVLYCSAESNSAIQAEMAHEACEELGLEAVDYTVATSNDIQTMVESMVGKVDVLYAPTDNVIAAGMSTVAMIANENGLPTVVGEQGMVDAGGLVTYTIDYKELGKVAGEMAMQILSEGTDPAEMPIEYYPSDKLQLMVNEDTAAELGIDPSTITME